jgi:hypothetical protein
VGIRHLEGKRSGRPRGSKSWPLTRVMNWVRKHVGKRDAKAPTPMAAELLDLARYDMVKFLACIAALERQDAATPALSPAPPRPPRRIKRVSLNKTQVGKVIAVFGFRNDEDKQPPGDWQLVDVAATAAGGIELVVTSSTFPQVAVGQAIPEMRA